MTKDLKFIALGLLLAFWVNTTAQKRTPEQANVLSLRHLPASTTDTSRVFYENYVNGIRIWNEFNSFMLTEWNPHFTNTELKLDSFYTRLPTCKFYLESARKINKKDTNTIIALIGVTRLLGDTVSLKKYLNEYNLQSKTSRSH